MKHNHLASTVGAIALASGLAWFPIEKASAFTFTPPPDNTAPSQATGGASRGGFIPPANNSAPTQATGGASRGGFIPPSDNSAPQQATGGASRGVFAPPSDNSAPQQATGGASRGAFTPPSGNSAPRQAEGGASRTNLYGSFNTDALVSMLAITPDSFYGTTLSERPTILVYLPASSAQTAVFSLKTEDEAMVYQMTVPVSGEEGIVAIQLPDDAPALEIGQNYHWYVALMVDGHLSPSTPYVDAWIQRISPTPTQAQALESGNTMEAAELLAANGVWYDSSAILAALRTAQPGSETLANSWAELLTSVGLTDVATAPVLASDAATN